MAKYMRRQDLVESSMAFQMNGKRLCDFTPEEKREYNRIRKQASREKEQIRQNEKEYRIKHWEETKRKKNECLNES